MIKRAALVVMVCLSGAAGAVRAETPALVDLEVRREGTSLLTSCRLAHGLTPEMRDEIAAGLETTIEYRIQVHRRRTFFPDQVLVKKKIEVAVRHDALTRQYTLVRQIEGGPKDTRFTAEEAEMREFLTSLRDIPTVDVAALEPGGEYYLKAKAGIGLVWRFYLIPWPLDTDWVRVPLAPADGNSLAVRP